MKHKLGTTTLCICVVLMVICGSIALPIYFRPFYYWQIDALGIPAATGFDKPTLVAAYDEVLDYLTLPEHPFGTGAFPHSESGAAHFADCKVLFDLNASALAVAMVGIVLLLWLKRRGHFRLCCRRGFHPAVWCGGGILTTFAVVGGLAALNFKAAFKVFHGILFPGKDNWLFDYRTDPIIKALPETYFMNCGLLILFSVLSLSVLLIAYGLWRSKKKTA